MPTPGPQAPPPAADVRYLVRQLVDPINATALEMLATVSDLQRQCVAVARKGGRTWDEVAAAVGMARQNAQRKFVDLDEARGTDGRSRQ